MFLFSSIYLSIPLVLNNNISITLDSLPYLTSLALVPTIGGFYWTNKALSLTETEKVQLFQMSEPFFASVLAYIILKQVITMYDLIAGILIMLGLFILEINTIKNLIQKKVKAW